MVAYANWPSGDGPSGAWSPNLVGVAVAFAAPWMAALWFLGPDAYPVPLAICVAGAGAWALRRAAKGDKWALAGLLAIGLVVPNIYFETREIGAASFNAQNGIKLAIWAAMGLVSIVRWRRIVHLVTAPLVWPLIAFAGLAIVSTLWSAVPGYTFAAAMGLMFTALFACLIAAELPRPLVFRILVGCTMFNFGSAAAAALILPDVAWVPPDAESTGYRLQGLSSHPNILAKEVAALCCLTAPFLVAAGRRYATMVLVGVALLIIAASGSRTSLLAMVFALAAPLAKRPGAIRFAALAAAIVVTPLLLLGSIGAAPDFGALVAGASRSGDSSELLTLTGRTELWGFIWQKIQDAPLLGYGFDAAEAVLSKDWWGQVDAGVEAHNMLLQSLLTLGVFGAVWLVTWFAQLFRRWLSDANSALLFFAPYLLVLSFTEAEICTHPDLVGFAGLLAVALDSTHACGAQK